MPAFACLQVPPTDRKWTEEEVQSSMLSATQGTRHTWLRSALFSLVNEACHEVSFCGAIHLLHHHRLPFISPMVLHG